MIKSELVAKIAEKNPYLTVKDVEKIIESVFDDVSEQLIAGKRIELRSFGAFDVKVRAARVGRNPATNEKVDVEEKKVAFFKTSKILYQKLND